MRRHSFFLKLLLGNLLLIGLIAVLAGWVSYRHLNASYRRQQRAHQERLAGVAREHFQRRWPLAPEVIDAECKAVFGGLAMRITVIADDGRVLADSEADPSKMVNHKTDDRPEVLAAMAGTASWDVRTSETLRREFRYYGMPLVHEGQVRAVVRTAMPIKEILERGGFIRHALLLAGGAMLVAAAALGALISWIWSSPLRQIARTADRIASGNLQARARISGSEELAHLAVSLNRMRDSIAEQIVVIASQRENLQTIVANLREGVVLLDRRPCIVMMNRSALELLAPEADPEYVRGKPLQAAVRVAEVIDAVNDLTATGRPVSRQVEVDLRGQRRTLDLHAARVGGGRPEGADALLVVRDITDLARTVAVKAEFVANASHELRTPLATIRAAIDSMSGLAPDDREAAEKFLAILDRQVARLEEMTQDLLDLHRVESARRPFRAEPIHLGRLAKWVQTTLTEPAAEKDVTLAVECADPSFELYAAEPLLQLILQNLVDNGIKFTGAGGRVECSLDAAGHEVTLRVADNGIGISPDIQDRVFERFFQADPARSNDVRGRGTGLGLAIVKHAAERLGARVGLDSTPGRGTTVTVVVPARAEA